MGMQIYAERKQLVTYINPIISQMKSGDADEDFSVRDFSDIESDMDLTRIYKGNQRKFHKTSEGIYIKNQQTNILSVDLVCRKFQFKSKEEPGIIHYVCKIIETTDKDLREFEGKALVQKVDN